MLLDEFAAGHTAAVPEWAIRIKKVRLAQPSGHCNGVQRSRLFVQCRQIRIEYRASVIVTVSRKQNLGLGQDLQCIDIGGQFALQATIDAIEPELFDQRRQASMHERGAVYNDNDRLRQQPPAILAIGPECASQREKTSGKLLVKFLAQDFGRRASGIPFFIRRKPSLTLLRRFVIGKRRILGFTDIAQIANHIHGFMIADQYMHRAARRMSLFLETHEQVHGGPRLRSAIENIAYDDEVGCAPRPTLFIVDNIRLLQRLDHRTESAMYVRDCDDAICIINSPLIGIRQWQQSQSDKYCQYAQQVFRVLVSWLAVQSSGNAGYRQFTTIAANGAMLSFDSSTSRSIEKMSVLRIVTFCLLAVVSNLSAVSADEKKPAKPNPLFSDNSPLEITITAPLSTLMLDRSREEDSIGQLTYEDKESGTVILDVGIRARGRFRRTRDVCSFTPLRLNFKKETTRKTLFTRTDKVKLVTHCRDKSERYSQGVLREYLAYRILNTMTDKSFRVRLLQVRYVDSESKKKDRVEFGFLIEPDKTLAKRLGMKVLDIAGTGIYALDGPYASLTSVFQYLIGNTDFSAIRGAQGEPCCHNHVLFGDETGDILSVPYDFDMSGFVNATYAVPNPKFHIRSVRTRVYRGRCIHDEHLDNTLKAYQDRKQEIYQLVNGLEHLSDKTRKQLIRYIDDFYATVDNPKKLDSRLKKRCT